MTRVSPNSLYSIILKLIIILSASCGVFLNLFMGEGPGLNFKALLYFTLQSNIGLMLWSIVMAAAMIDEVKNKKSVIKRWMYVLQFDLTICITLTGFVFCFILLPTLHWDANNLCNILLHIVTPIAAIIDFLAFGPKKTFTYKNAVATIILPLCYLGFASICYFAKVSFAIKGEYFPYFFLNYGSPAGFFGFSDKMPYFMGSFYWIASLILIFIGIASLYVKILNRKKEKDEPEISSPAEEPQLMK